MKAAAQAAPVRSVRRRLRPAAALPGADGGAGTDGADRGAEAAGAVTGAAAGEASTGVT